MGVAALLLPSSLLRSLCPHPFQGNAIRRQSDKGNRSRFKIWNIPIGPGGGLSPAQKKQPKLRDWKIKKMNTTGQRVNIDVQRRSQEGPKSSQGASNPIFVLIVLSMTTFKIMFVQVEAPKGNIRVPMGLWSRCMVEALNRQARSHGRGSGVC